MKCITEELTEYNKNENLNQQKSIISKEELDKKFEAVNKMIFDLENKNNLNKKWLKKNNYLCIKYIPLIFIKNFIL